MKKEKELKNIEQCYGKECLNCPDRCQWYACGIDVIREKKETLAIHNGARHIANLEQADTAEAMQRDFLPEAEPGGESSVRTGILEALNRVAFLYLDYPKLFDALIRRIYLYQNQSEIARSRGVTRAAVSKELRQGVTNMMTRELGLKTPVAKPDKLLGLTPEEFAVYKIMFLDGCSVRSTAAQLGISKSKAARMGQILRRKLGKNGTVKNGVSKKS